MYKYNKEIESLIEMAISDGEITDKELKVLQKKATQYNIDEDELDMVLEYRLENRRKELGLNNESKSNIETDKIQTRDYNKCNSCGFIRQNDEDKCPYCGYVFPSALDIFKIELADARNKAYIEVEKKRKEAESNDSQKSSIINSIGSSFKNGGVFGVLETLLEGKESEVKKYDEYYEHDLYESYSGSIIVDFKVPEKNESLLNAVTFFYSKLALGEECSKKWLEKYLELYNASINRFSKSLFSKSEERKLVDMQYNELKKKHIIK